MTARQGKRDPKAQAAREADKRLTQLEALGQRAVACRHWRWMAGMLGSWRGLDGYWFRVVRVQGSVVQCYDETSWSWENADTNIKPDDLPDLSDPATLGCLLHLVREAWPDEYLTIAPQKLRIRWLIDLPNGKVALGDSEAEALVAALEAAP